MRSINSLPFILKCNIVYLHFWFVEPCNFAISKNFCKLLIWSSFFVSTSASWQSFMIHSNFVSSLSTIYLTAAISILNRLSLMMFVVLTASYKPLLFVKHVIWSLSTWEVFLRLILLIKVRFQLLLLMSVFIWLVLIWLLFLFFWLPRLMG